MKIVTGKCTENDLYKPVLQVILSDGPLTRSKDGKQMYKVWLSDGSFFQVGYIPYDIFISNKLQKGSIVQLHKFQLANLFPKRFIAVFNLTVIHSKCDSIGDPKLYPLNETSLVERTTPTISDNDHVEEPPTSKQKQQSHVNSLLNEDIDDSHHVEEPTTSIQNPLTSTQKCSSHSPTQNKKRKLQSNDDAISVLGKDLSDVMKMLVVITNDIRVLYKKVETLEEDVSIMKRMMMDKNKEDDMGACIEKLDKIGWAAQDPMYDTAILLFGQSADYRKLWLHLKPESCGNWVKNAGSMFGLLD